MFSELDKAVVGFTGLRAATVFALVIGFYASVLGLPRFSGGSLVIALCGGAVYSVAVMWGCRNEGGVRSALDKLRGAGAGGFVVIIPLVVCFGAFALSLLEHVGVVPLGTFFRR